MVDCLKSYYDKQGFVTGVPIISVTEALTHRSILDAVEAERGPMQYQLAMNSPYKLATLPNLLDMVVVFSNFFSAALAELLLHLTPST